MSALTTVFAQGVAASRPAAASTNNGWFYLATDTNGGTLYQSNGSSWVQCGAGVSGTTPTFVGAKAHNSTDQTISNNSLTNLTFDTNNWDTSSFHSTVSNTDRFVAPSTGKYLVEVIVTWAVNTSGRRFMAYLVNGGSEVPLQDSGASTDSGNFTTMNGSDIVSLSSGDYVTVHVLQTSGGSLAAKASKTFVSLTLLGS